MHQQVKELQKQGCEVIVISPTPWLPFPINHFSKKWKLYSEVPDKMICDGIEVYYPRFLQFPKNLFSVSSGRRLYSGIRKLVEEIYGDFKFDVIQSHVALSDGFAGMMLKRQYNRPLVVTVHGDDLQVTIYRGAGCYKALARVFQNADKIVTVSAKLKRLIEDNFGFPQKLIVNNNGIKPDEITSGNTELASRYAGSQVILSVSYLNTEKGLELNIKTIARITSKYPALKYLVIGNGPQAFALRKLSHDLNLENQIEFLGELTHDKVMQYMTIADIFSLPSWNEGFGIVYIEAMAHGKPVIACEGEGIADVIEHGETGLLIKPKDVESLTQAMDFLLSNPDKAREIGERAKKLVLENYTWEKNARKYIELYKELITNYG